MHSQQNQIHVPKQLNHKRSSRNSKANSSMLFIINGCVVSFSSNAKDADEPIKTAKSILLSAYRTKVVNK